MPNVGIQRATDQDLLDLEIHNGKTQILLHTYLSLYVSLGYCHPNCKVFVIFFLEKMMVVNLKRS